MATLLKIRFADKDKARGFVELARRVKMICLPNDEYLLAADNLRLLDELGLTYEVVGEESFYEALCKIRNLAAPAIQRRDTGGSGEIGGNETRVSK